MATKINLPAMPFYVGDWLKCPEVKVLPPDIRGLWFDMICYMWESVERGVMVKPTHHPYSKDEIVRMIGKDCNDSGKWLDTLIENGVCAIRDADGAIYSRRMVRDEDTLYRERVVDLRIGIIFAFVSICFVTKGEEMQIPDGLKESLRETFDNLEKQIKEHTKN